MISHSPVSSVLVRVNIVAARLTNICNKTMCALLSSARLGDALPRLQLWTVAGLLGGNVTRARVTPTLRRSGYTLSREERAGHSRERGETRRRAGEQSGYNTHPCWPTRPPALLTKTSFTNHPVDAVTCSIFVVVVMLIGYRRVLFAYFTFPFICDGNYIN